MRRRRERIFPSLAALRCFVAVVGETASFDLGGVAGAVPSSLDSPLVASPRTALGDRVDGETLVGALLRVVAECSLATEEAMLRRVDRGESGREFSRDWWPEMMESRLVARARWCRTSCDDVELARLPRPFSSLVTSTASFLRTVQQISGIYGKVEDENLH